MIGKKLLSATKILKVLVLVALAATSVLADQEKILHNLIAFPHGVNQQSNLIADAAGNLYGTTHDGGVGNGCAPNGCGTVFELKQASKGVWTQIVLYNFGSVPSDGTNPSAGLIFDAAGNMYGTTTSGGSSTCSCGAVFELSPTTRGKWKESILYSFVGGTDGDYPESTLARDSSGDLFGTTIAGGYEQGSCLSRCGVIFELTPGSGGKWTETVLHAFTGGEDGGQPNGVILDEAGNLYGSTYFGGDLTCGPEFNTLGCGVVFEFAPPGKGNWSEVVLHTFTLGDGGFPLGNLIFDTAGALYGTTQSGPGIGCEEDGCGTIFRLVPKPDGSWTHHMLYNFEGGPDGALPAVGLTPGENGVFFGTTQGGGSTKKCPEGCGTIFELTPRGKNWAERVIHRFDEGTGLVTGLVADSTGKMYGSTPWSGDLSCSSVGTSCGSVFELTQDSEHRWEISQVYAFEAGRVGLVPSAGFVSDDAGNLYGTTSAGGRFGNGTVFELMPKSSGGWNTIILHAFTGGRDGSTPEASLTFDPSGNLYGTTSEGGSSTGCYGYRGCGTVFKLSRLAHGWKESVLYRFKGGSTDGAVPFAGVALDVNGNVYGSTTFGGNSACQFGCGTVFKLSPSADQEWKEQVLQVFHYVPDGAYPESTLVFDKSGNLYGSNVAGGAAQSDGGTVFRLTLQNSPGSTVEILYSFTGKQDGGVPRGLTFGSDDDLYGTTGQGGNSTGCSYGAACGTVFRLSFKGNTWKEKVLYSFQGGSDGAWPYASPTFDSGGNLYGTTTTDGSFEDCGAGTVYKLSPASGKWTEQVLHNFGDYFDTSDGSCPQGGVILDGIGNIFGTTAGGGTDILGTIFELSPGLETTSHREMGHRSVIRSGATSLRTSSPPFSHAGSLTPHSPQGR